MPDTKLFFYFLKNLLLSQLYYLKIKNYTRQFLDTLKQYIETSVEDKV